MHVTWPYWGETWPVDWPSLPASLHSAFARSFSFFLFIRRFWNHTLTCKYEKKFQFLQKCGQCDAYPSFLSTFKIKKGAVDQSKETAAVKICGPEHPVLRFGRFHITQETCFSSSVKVKVVQRAPYLFCAFQGHLSMNVRRANVQTRFRAENEHWSLPVLTCRSVRWSLQEISHRFCRVM